MRAYDVLRRRRAAAQPDPQAALERFARDGAFSIPDDTAETTLVVRAEDASGVFSPPESVHVTYAPPSGELYLLAIGVNDYDDNRLDLRDGKNFFAPAVTTTRTFNSLQADVEAAFRYRTRFTSSTGRTQ